MTEKRYVLFNRKDTDYILDTPNTDLDFIEMLGDALTSEEIVDLLNSQDERIKELENFENSREHIRLSINIETGELQRHKYATGQWFGDFDRILVKNFINEEDYQRFVNRVIEVYNTEFKGDDDD